MTDNPQTLFNEGSEEAGNMLQQAERALKTSVSYSERALKVMLGGESDLRSEFLNKMRAEPDYRMTFLGLSFFGASPIEEAVIDGYYRLEQNGLVGLPAPEISSIVVGLLTSTFAMSGSDRGDDVYMLHVPHFKPGIGTIVTNLNAVTQLMCTPKVAERIFRDTSSIVHNRRNNQVYGGVATLLDQILLPGWDADDLQRRVKQSSDMFSPKTHRRVYDAGKSFTDGLGIK